jgi:hypothetical protein
MRKFVVIAAVFAAVVIAAACGWPSFARHHQFCSRAVCASYDETLAKPGEVAFEVRSRSGRPVRGVTVDTLSGSGWAGDAVTDPSGAATLHPGEWEVLAIRIDEEVITFWPSPMDALAGPDTGTGVRFRVVIR